MNTTSDKQWQDWGDTGADAPVKPAVDRRRLLGGVGGSLALAASGLFLPDWLAETEAREGALGGAKGGRRGQDNRGRHKKRSHGDKKDKHKDHKPGDIIPTHPGILVSNKRSVPVQTRGWQQEQPHAHGWSVPSGWDWAAIPAKAANGGISTREFPSEKYWTVVQIGTDRAVEFVFGLPFLFPDAFIYSGGFEGDDWYPKGPKLDQREAMSIGDSFSVPGIKATRINSTNRHVWLEVELT